MVNVGENISDDLEYLRQATNSPMDTLRMDITKEEALLLFAAAHVQNGNQRPTKTMMINEMSASTRKFYLLYGSPTIRLKVGQGQLTVSSQESLATFSVADFS